MDRRAPVAVAALALLLVVSTAGCVEVKDRPESGPFTIGLEMPPMLLLDENGDWLAGTHAQVETELENKTPAYSWDIDGDGIADLNGSVAIYPGGSEGIHVVHYIVSYYGQQREIPLFLGVGGARRAAVADALFLGNASRSTPGLRTPLSILEGYGLAASTEGPEGTVFGDVRYPLTRPLGIFISLPSHASGPTTYVASFALDIDNRSLSSTEVFRIWPGERHHVQFTLEGQTMVNITGNSGTAVVYSGPAQDMPANRTATLGVLEWTGRVGEEPAPGPGWLAATVALLSATLVFVRRRGRSGRITPAS